MPIISTLLCGFFFDSRFLAISYATQNKHEITSKLSPFLSWKCGQQHNPVANEQGQRLDSWPREKAD